MKNSIFELKSYEMKNVSGGLKWHISWDAAKMFLAFCTGYSYELQQTPEALLSYDKNNHWESLKKVAWAFGIDLFIFSTIFTGARNFINAFIPFLAVSSAKAKHKRR